jgi:hypothetical protein
MCGHFFLVVSCSVFPPELISVTYTGLLVNNILPIKKNTITSSMKNKEKRGNEKIKIIMTSQRFSSHGKLMLTGYS